MTTSGLVSLVCVTFPSSHAAFVSLASIIVASVVVPLSISFVSAPLVSSIAPPISSIGLFDAASPPEFLSYPYSPSSNPSSLSTVECEELCLTSLSSMCATASA